MAFSKEDCWDFGEKGWDFGGLDWELGSWIDCRMQVWRPGWALGPGPGAAWGRPRAQGPRTGPRPGGEPGPGPDRGRAGF